MAPLRCVFTVPNRGEDYSAHFARLAGMGVDIDWRGDELMNSMDETLVADVCRGYDIVLSSNERWADAAFTACRDKLRLMLRYGIGYDNVDLGAADRAGVMVANLPGCNAKAVAEHAVMLMSAAFRNVGLLHCYVKAGAIRGQHIMSRSLYGKTVGLLGFGHIGKEAAAMLRGFGCPVLAHDIALDDAAAKQYGVERVGKEELFRRSDVVSVHLPLMPATRHTVNRNTLSLMKQNAIVVNTSRGGLVDSSALAEALREKRIYAAGLDVFEDEGNGPGLWAHDFLDIDNVVLTPHTAAMTRECFDHMMEQSVDAIALYLAGKPLPGLLTRAATA